MHCNGLMQADLGTVVRINLSRIQAEGFKFSKHFNFKAIVEFVPGGPRNGGRGNIRRMDALEEALEINEVA